jgi:hypothetical protein
VNGTELKDTDDEDVVFAVEEERVVIMVLDSIEIQF